MCIQDKIKTLPEDMSLVFNFGQTQTTLFKNFLHHCDQDTVCLYATDEKVLLFDPTCRMVMEFYVHNANSQRSGVQILFSLAVQQLRNVLAGETIFSMSLLRDRNGFKFFHANGFAEIKGIELTFDQCSKKLTSTECLLEPDRNYLIGRVNVETLARVKFLDDDSITHCKTPYFDLEYDGNWLFFIQPSKKTSNLSAAPIMAKTRLLLAARTDQLVKASSEMRSTVSFSRFVKIPSPIKTQAQVFFDKDLGAFLFRFQSTDVDFCFSI
jgi:hypothetical protein